MKRVLSCFAVLCLVVFCFVAQAHDVREHKILRVSDGARVDLKTMIKDLKAVELIFIGERHDQASHHEAQAAVIQGLYEAGLRVAVGLEMFRKENQAALDDWVAGKLTEDVFEGIYYQNWSSPWDLYRDIFVYAREKKIPIIGLNISPEISRQVATQGFDSLTPEQIGQLPPVTCDVDGQYMSFIRRAFGMHGHGKDKSFVHFCEAQIVWDTAMASNLLAFHKKNPEYKMVVLAGSGHAWKRGIPEQVRRQSNMSYRVILPEIPERAESGVVTADDADYLWLGL